METQTEAIKFLEEQLNKIHLVECYFISNHGVNMYFILNVNQLDLSKDHPDELCFYNKEGKYLIDYNKKTNIFYLSYKNIWIKLKENFGLNDQEIIELIKSVLEEHFKCTVDATRTHNTFFVDWLEEHFKCKKKIISIWL